jgi:UDP-hydrolysing UDP-N-acetyl-D-glucosamine 2-epimerase
MSLHVAYASTCRSDYGPSYWLLHDLFADARFRPSLLVGGAHLSERHGMTVQEIERDGFAIAARVPFLDDERDDWPAACARALTGFAAELERLKPDLLILYGDRLELLPIATAALITDTPTAHLCGGDLTEGAIDDRVRHSVTKLAHLHFPSSARSAERILQMGEEPWRVHVAGDPALDHFVRGGQAGDAELAEVLGFVPDERTVLVTLHPTTMEAAQVPAEAAALTTALLAHDGRVVVTAPAPDPGADAIRAAMERLRSARAGVVFVESLGSRRYRAVMKRVGAMVGNSSSGLNEAPCVPLPVVNVGRRQAGRDRAANVIDVEPDAAAICAALARALSPSFRAALVGLESPYGDGHAAARILAQLVSLPTRERLLGKRFTMVGAAAPAIGGAPRSIGGDYALDDTLLQGDAETALFASGRDALAALAPTGVWLVPEYLCPVVPDTLRQRGASVRPYPWLTPWTVDVAALRERLPGARGIIVPFHLGLAPGDEIWPALAESGLILVEDRCQCVGPPPTPDELRGDFAIGSLRKWLPVPDGGYLVSRTGAAARPGADSARRMVRLRSAAGLVKAARESGPDTPLLERASVDLFRAGETELGDGSGRRASALAARVLACTDLPALRARRLRNQRWLAAAIARLPGLELVEPAPGAIVASETLLLALPISCRDRDGLRARLAEQRIFCAVHWRDGDWSSAGGRAAEWARTHLSLPIDQRLELADLERLAQALA